MSTASTGCRAGWGQLQRHIIMTIRGSQTRMLTGGETRLQCVRVIVL